MKVKHSTSFLHNIHINRMRKTIIGSYIKTITWNNEHHLKIFCATVSFFYDLCNKNKTTTTTRNWSTFNVCFFCWYLLLKKKIIIYFYTYLLASLDIESLKFIRSKEICFYYCGFTKQFQTHLLNRYKGSHS